MRPRAMSRVLLDILAVLVLIGAVPSAAFAATTPTVISGVVWFDANGNGVQDPGEAPAGGAGITVQCASCPGAPVVGGTNADVNGHYTVSLAAVPGPQQYRVSGLANAATGQRFSGAATVALAPTDSATVNLGLLPSGPVPSGPTPDARRCFALTGFCVANDTIWDYFQRRGGVPTFGYPTSRPFTLQGFTVQFFQRRIVQLAAAGAPRLLNLLDPGLLPYTAFNGSTFPAVDSGLVATAPDPTDQPAVLAWVRQHAPDRVGDAAANFSQTFAGTVSEETAFPTGGDPGLLPGVDLELWGVPTSGAFTDATNHGFLYLRWQRGIMHFDAACHCTQGILLADYFKAILTGKNLPSDLDQESAGSPFRDQYDPHAPHWVHDPRLLPDTDLTQAFTPEIPVADLGTPKGVVRAFLQCVVQDPSGQTCRLYLSQGLQAQLPTAGAYPAHLFGIQSPFGQFTILGGGIAANGMAVVRATLDYPPSPGIPVSFLLVPENGQWRIDRVQHPT